MFGADEDCLGKGWFAWFGASEQKAQGAGCRFEVRRTSPCYSLRLLGAYTQPHAFGQDRQHKAEQRECDEHFYQGEPFGARVAAFPGYPGTALNSNYHRNINLSVTKQKNQRETEKQKPGDGRIRLRDTTPKLTTDIS